MEQIKQYYQRVTDYLGHLFHSTGLEQAVKRVPNERQKEFAELERALNEVRILQHFKAVERANLGSRYYHQPTI